jgi:hypothetical protein
MKFQSVQNKLVNKNILSITLFHYLIPYDKECKVVENIVVSHLHTHLLPPFFLSLRVLTIYLIFYAVTLCFIMFICPFVGPLIWINKKLQYFQPYIPCLMVSGNEIKLCLKYFCLPIYFVHFEISLTFISPKPSPKPSDVQLQATCCFTFIKCGFVHTFLT